MSTLEEIVLAWWHDQWRGASADFIIAGRTKQGMPSIDETEIALIRAAEAIVQQPLT